MGAYVCARHARSQSQTSQHGPVHTYDGTAKCPVSLCARVREISTHQCRAIADTMSCRPLTMCAQSVTEEALRQLMLTVWPGKNSQLASWEVWKFEKHDSRQVCMACDPATVSGTPVDVAWLQVKHVSAGCASHDHIAACDTAVICMSQHIYRPQGNLEEGQWFHSTMGFWSPSRSANTQVRMCMLSGKPR